MGSTWGPLEFDGYRKDSGYLRGAPWDSETTAHRPGPPGTARDRPGPPGGAPCRRPSLTARRGTARDVSRHGDASSGRRRRRRCRRVADVSSRCSFRAARLSSRRTPDGDSTHHVGRRQLGAARLQPPVVTRHQVGTVCVRVRVRERALVRACMRVCVCVCVCMCMYACLYVCAQLKLHD